MKKIISLAIFGFAVFVSCENQPPESPEERFKAVWRTTHQFYSVVVASALPISMLEELRERVELESDTAISESESYQLAFRKDGTGAGSAIVPEDGRRHDFGFTWQTSDDVLFLTWDGSGSGFGGMILTERISHMKETAWNIEESTPDKMVLSMEMVALVNGVYGTQWSEIHTFRHTFERVD